MKIEGQQFTTCFIAAVWDVGTQWNLHRLYTSETAVVTKSSNGKAIPAYGLMMCVRLSVCPSVVHVCLTLVNLCVEVLEFALQSSAVSCYLTHYVLEGI